MRKLVLALGLLLFGSQAQAAVTCFWINIAISNVAQDAVNSNDCQFTLVPSNTNVGGGNPNQPYNVGDTVAWSAITGGPTCAGSAGAGTGTIVAKSSTNLITVNQVAASPGAVTSTTLYGGRWNTTDVTHWSTATNGGTSCTAPPHLAGDQATIDAVATSAATIVPDMGGTITLTNFTLTNFAGTLDNTVNNNNFTISSAMLGTNTGAGTIKAGNATWSFTATTAGTAMLNCGGSCNWTANASGSPTTIQIGSTSSNQRQLTLTNKRYGNYSALNNSGPIIFSGTSTWDTFTIGSGASVVLGAASNLTINTSCAVNGASGIGNQSAFGSVQSTLPTVTTSGCTMTWAAIGGLAFTSASNVTATNSFDLSNRSISGGGTLSITPPGAGGGGVGVIGSGI